MHQKQILELARATEEWGVTLVPLSFYFKDGRAKVELAIARGKTRYDKRLAIAERDAKRETQRALKGDREQPGTCRAGQRAYFGTGGSQLPLLDGEGFSRRRRFGWIGT